MNPEKTADAVKKLAAPGAGLPPIDRWLLRYLVGPVISKIAPLKKVRSDYESLTNYIVKEVSQVDAKERTRPVLVGSITGLEDSSRYWSLNDVLEHLLIVTRNVEGAIRSLGNGVIPPGVGDPARVKPKGGGSDFLPDFIEYAPRVLEKLDQEIANQKLNIHSKLEYPHLWFGGFKARQWYWLLSTHQAIHAKQVKLIVLGLKNADS